jgi:hypothetical protein
VQLCIPPRPAEDWHLVLRLSLYPNRSKLQAFSYSFHHQKRSPSRQLFNPRFLDRPETHWEAVQALSYGVDLLSDMRQR